MTWVIDSSVLVSVVLGEPGAEEYVRLLSGHRERLVVGAATLLEAGMVVEARVGNEAVDDLALLLAELQVEVVPFDEEQAHEGQMAWRRFGRGRHPARLNFGDCLTYALTRCENAELLFVGDDFSQTDVRVAST